MADATVIKGLSPKYLLEDMPFMEDGTNWHHVKILMFRRGWISAVFEPPHGCEKPVFTSHTVLTVFPRRLGCHHERSKGKDLKDMMENHAILKLWLTISQTTLMTDVLDANLIIRLLSAYVYDCCSMVDDNFTPAKVRIRLLPNNRW